MASPAEAHRELKAEQGSARRLHQLEGQHLGLIAILHSVGFGSREGNWEEREIKNHLEAALRLCELSMSAIRKTK